MGNTVVNLPPNFVLAGRGDAIDGAGGVYGSSEAQEGVLGESVAPQGPGVRGDSKNWDGVHGESESDANAGVSGINNGKGPGVWAWSKSGYAGYFKGDAYVQGTLSANAGQFGGDVHVQGTLTADVDIVLGADCAEEFEVTTAAQAEPGTVMIINEDGKLEASAREYDKRVAGVISGAGDYRPGILLHHRAPSNDRRPVALVGKVYCNVDAGYAPIDVGDLLTTSPTRGFAMKAADSSKAFGAVIGKALASLETGQNMIPILIALQ